MNLQENIKKVLVEWPELDSVFSTSDNKVFIRLEEAQVHTNVMMNANPEEFVDTTILEWFEEYSGADAEPKIRSIKVELK